MFWFWGGHRRFPLGCFFLLTGCPPHRVLAPGTVRHDELTRLGGLMCPPRIENRLALTCRRPISKRELRGLVVSSACVPCLHSVLSRRLLLQVRTVSFKPGHDIKPHLPFIRTRFHYSASAPIHGQPLRPDCHKSLSVPAYAFRR